jgi:adenylate cyclase
MDRKLTTIFAADLAGFSRLMAADEEGVIESLRAARREVIDPPIVTGGGRIIKTMGDGLLVEFKSPVQAIRAALQIQNEMQAWQVRVAESKRLKFRIGINLGDVVIDGDDVLGDAVNIAARLESLAPVGGLCISRAVFDQVQGRIDAEMTSLGFQAVKNMPKSVEVWRVEVEGAELTKPTALPAERPSIAVLPFVNMSSDPDQEFLADGIVEDVITELSRFRSLLLIARNSTFAYKDAAQDVRQIGKELGVRYVVEGSVRRGGKRLRVTAQLIEAATGTHVWANRWDRTVDDLFDLQDELTHAIVTAVEPELGAHERRLARTRPTESLTSWELCQRGWSKLAEYKAASLDEAADLLQASADTDRDFALPRALQARVANIRVAIGLPEQSKAITEGLAWAREALAIDDRLEVAHGALAVLLAMSGQAEEAADAAAIAIALNPNNAFCHHASALAELFKRQPDTAKMVAGGEAAMRLSPKDPSAHAFQNIVTIGHLIEHLDHDDPAYQKSARAAARYPGAPWYVHLQAATVEVAIGNKDVARKHIETALALSPTVTMASYQNAFKFPIAEKLFELGDRSGTTEGLIELGLPRE